MTTGCTLSLDLRSDLDIEHEAHQTEKQNGNLKWRHLKSAVTQEDRIFKNPGSALRKRRRVDLWWGNSESFKSLRSSRRSWVSKMRKADSLEWKLSKIVFELHLRSNLEDEHATISIGFCLRRDADGQESNHEYNTGWVLNWRKRGIWC